jgi:singapore isolate B (sub-type 7) whole genome shotgun sequence assembly, scaffold_18
MHSNTICIVGLAFGHEILVAGKKCVGVAFGVDVFGISET